MQQILELIRRVRTQLAELWQRTQPKDRIRFFIITAVALAVIVTAVLLLTRTQYGVLYTDMEPADAGEVRQVLSEMNIPSRLQGPGTVLVPEQRVDETITALAAQGYPKSGFTYDYISQISGFGVTESDKALYKNIQIQERLRQTLSVNPNIRDSVVTIAQPNNRSVLFPGEEQPTTASVMLWMRGDAVLTAEQVAVVENTVAAAVEGLLPENVMITDDSFRRLNQDSEDDFNSITDQYLMELRVQEELQRNIMAILGPIYGAQHVTAQVKVALNFDDIQSEEVTFSPVVDDEGIIVSSRETIEQASGGRVVGGEPGVDPNGGAPMDDPEYPEVETDPGYSYSLHTTEINREVNQLVEKIKQAKGSIENMTAAIAIDSVNLDEENTDTAAVQSLVAGTLGLERSDYNRISVQVQRFSGVEAQEAAYNAYQQSLERQRLFDLIRTLSLYGLIFLCMLIIGLRIIKLLHPGPTAEELAAMAEMGGEGALDEYDELVRLATQENTEDIDMATKSPEWTKVEDFIDRSPDMVANLLRNWFNEEPERGGRR